MAQTMGQGTVVAAMPCSAQHSPRGEGGRQQGHELSGVAHRSAGIQEVAYRGAIGSVTPKACTTVT